MVQTYFSSYSLWPVSPFKGKTEQENPTTPRHTHILLYESYQACYTNPVISSPAVPGSEDSAAGGFQVSRAQRLPHLFRSSLTKHAKDEASALLSHRRLNSPSQLSLLPALCRHRMAVAELIRADPLCGQAPGLDRACSALPEPASH